MPYVLLRLQKASGVNIGTEGQILRFSRSKKSVDIVTRDGEGALVGDFRKHADAHTQTVERTRLFVRFLCSCETTCSRPCDVNRQIHLRATAVDLHCVQARVSCITGGGGGSIQVK